MHLVEVDPVGAEAAEALVARATDVVGGEPAIVRAVAHLAVDLGGEDDPVAPRTILGEPATDDLLGAALPVFQP